MHSMLRTALASQLPTPAIIRKARLDILQLLPSVLYTLLTDTAELFPNRRSVEIVV